ncbi:MAG: response regulator [Anaerolineae bacterium]|nr:response regulator [Anaerolineae bacterium]
MREIEKIRLLIVDDIPETRENLRKLLWLESDMDVVGTATNGEEGIQAAVELHPDIVLMDINMPGVDGITASERISHLVPFCQIIMMSIQGEADYLRRSMLAGAREFLIKPFSSDELVSSIRRVYQLGATRRQAMLQMSQSTVTEKQPDKAGTDSGRIVSVFSLKGGVGCSTIAVNLAIALKKNWPLKVALVDTSLQAGDVAVLLNLYASRTIADLALDADELDSELISDIFISHSSGINALLAPPRPEVADTVTPTLVTDVLVRLRRMFDIIIVDTHHVLDDLSLSVMDICDKIIVVTTPEIPAIKDAKLFFEVAEKLEYARDRIVFMLNMVDKRINIRAEDIEANIKYRIEAQLPFDRQLVTTAANQGVPYLLGDKTSLLARATVSLGEILIRAFNPPAVIKFINQITAEEQISPPSANNLIEAIKSLEELQILERLEIYEQNVTMGRVIDELERIIAGIPHDLKEPLGVSQNILEDLSQLSSTTFPHEDIRFCQHKLDYTLLLVNRLIATTACGELQVRTNTILANVLHTLPDLVQPTSEVTIPVEINIEPPDLSLQVKDSDLQQIIFCLLENAIEATPARGQVQIKARSIENQCYLEIFDAGGEIAESEQNQLYLPTYTTKTGHAGLGLFVCKRIISQYSGSITVSNRKDGPGVVARVILPKEFKRRAKPDQSRNYVEALQTYLDLPLNQTERDSVNQIIIKNLKVFVTQITSILNNIEATLSEIQKQVLLSTYQEQRLPLRTVLRNCAYARSVVGSLLEPSQTVQIQSVSLSSLLLEVLSLFESKLPEKCVYLSPSIKKVDSEIWIMADPTQFRRVFFNLTRNALEAMRQSGEFKLIIQAHVEDDFAVIQFIDSGIGISAENRRQIFNHGFSTKAKGRGVGLYVAKTIIEQHQGRIEVQSQVGQGTCFTIYWPATTSPAKPMKVSSLTGNTFLITDKKIPEANTKTLIVSSASPSIQILIVEDDRDWLESLTRYLRSQDYTLCTSRKAGDAIELIQSNSYALVLLDWSMPGVGGQGVLEVAQSTKPDMPVFILSAYGYPEQRSLALQLGAKVFLDKPQNKAQWEKLKQKVLETITNN